MPRPPISNPPLHSWASTSLRRPSRIASRLNSWCSFVRCWSRHRAPGVGRVASNRQPAEQVHERSHRRQQYHRTARRTGRPVPRLWRRIPGLAAMKIHLLWDFLADQARSSNCESPPAHQRRYQPDRPGGRPGRVAVAVRPGLLLSGSVPEPHAGRCFLDLSAAQWHVGLQDTPRASPWHCCNTCGSRQGQGATTCRSCWA